MNDFQASGEVGGDTASPTFAQAPAFLANLLVFTACAALAFYRNIDGLFHGFDGIYGTAPALVRVDGLLTGIVFERDLDAVLAFRTGLLRNPTCRWQDYQDVRAMLR